MWAGVGEGGGVGGEVREETLWLVCGLWLAAGTPAECTGEFFRAVGMRLGDAGVVITALASWGNPQSTRAWSPEPGSSLSFLNYKALPALDLSFPICKVG